MDPVAAIPPTLVALTATLRRYTQEMPSGALPALLGELEAAKALAWARLVVPEPSAREMPPDCLVGAAEMARLLGLPEHWVRDHARRKLIPALKVGHYIVFDPPTVIAAVRALGTAQDQPSCGRSAGKSHKSKQLRPPAEETEAAVDTESVQELVSRAK